MKYLSFPSESSSRKPRSTPFKVTSRLSSIRVSAPSNTQRASYKFVQGKERTNGTSGRRKKRDPKEVWQRLEDIGIKGQLQSPHRRKPSVHQHFTDVRTKACEQASADQLKTNLSSALQWYSFTTRDDAADRESRAGENTIHRGWLFLRQRKRKEASTLIFQNLSIKL